MDDLLKEEHDKRGWARSFEVSKTTSFVCYDYVTSLFGIFCEIEFLHDISRQVPLWLSKKHLII